MRSVHKVSSHAIWKIFIEEDTRYKKHCTQDNDTSAPFKVMTFLRKSGPLVAVRVALLATTASYSFCSGTVAADRILLWHVSGQDPASKSRTHSVWNPQISRWLSHCQSQISADCSLHMLSTLRGSACCRPSRTGVALNRYGNHLGLSEEVNLNQNPHEVKQLEKRIKAKERASGKGLVWEQC